MRIDGAFMGRKASEYYFFISFLFFMVHLDQDNGPKRRAREKNVGPWAVDLKTKNNGNPH